LSWQLADGLFSVLRWRLTGILAGYGRSEEMSTKPKIDHEYHAGKDKFKITIRGYSLGKKARDEILKRVMAAVERNPDRLIADAGKKSRKGSSKELRGLQKSSRLIEVGD
jgi:hypothetical protein